MNVLSSKSKNLLVQSDFTKENKGFFELKPVDTFKYVIEDVHSKQVITVVDEQVSFKYENVKFYFFLQAGTLALADFDKAENNTTQIFAVREREIAQNMEKFRFFYIQYPPNQKLIGVDRTQGLAPGAPISVLDSHDANLTSNEFFFCSKDDVLK